MKLSWMFAAGIALGLALPAQARVEDQLDFDGARRHDVRVVLQPEQNFVPASEDVRLLVTFENAGRAPIALAKWFVPGDEFDHPVFEVLRDGQPVEFMGPLVKRAEPTADDVLWLLPGEQMTVAVELSGSYDLSAGGEYSIRYRAASANLFGPGQGRVEVLASAEVSIAVEGRQYSNVRALAGDGYKAKPGGGGGGGSGAGVEFSGRCSAAQQSTLLSSVSAASTMSGDAKNYLSTTTPGATSRYTTWFGAYTNARWNLAKEHFVAIKGAFDGQTVTLDCSCKKSYYAYVYPTQPYKIYVCNAFWTAPLTGTDSKGGTLVHEMSHFNVTAGTDDWAYGQSAAKSLASSDPIKALDNADNHEYFSENTPQSPN